jgi:serine/threonine protein kinase
MTNQKEPDVPAGQEQVAARAETDPDSAVPTAGGARGPKSQKLELPVVVGNRYKLLETRGGGGMAKVYRGFDLTLERDVAVKIINPELRNDPEFDARFQREARIASQLADPHIVVVHDFGIDADCGPFLVMEFLQGQTLRERLSTGGPLPLKAGLQLCAQLLLALIHAHNKNIIHRDIKPDNVFILNISGVRLHVRVLDFGIARILRGDESSHLDHPPLTQPGAVLGTPRYMAPEQLAGQPADARSDIYSAAMVIHEALTGKLPFVTGKSTKELCPEASDELCNLLTQCLKQNPNERPKTAIEVYLRIQELGKASGILLLPPGAMEKLAKSRGDSQTAPTITYVPVQQSARPWLPWALAGAGALAIGALVGWLLFHG